MLFAEFRSDGWLVGRQQMEFLSRSRAHAGASYSRTAANQDITGTYPHHFFVALFFDAAPPANSGLLRGFNQGNNLLGTFDAD